MEPICLWLPQPSYSLFSSKCTDPIATFGWGMVVLDQLIEMTQDRMRGTRTWNDMVCLGLESTGATGKSAESGRNFEPTPIDGC